MTEHTHADTGVPPGDEDCAEYLERMVGSIDQFVSALHDRA